MTTDHYAEADGSLEQSMLTAEREDATLFALQAIAGATLALTDAVRALKAGATVTTQHVELDPAQIGEAVDAAVRRYLGKWGKEATRG